MPPSVLPISNLKNFRGNVLDRQFPVQFDPKTGLYSYDYVDKTPEVEAKLKNLKFFRKSSKDLAEIEADLAAYLAKEGPAAPPVTGEITKAIEAEAAKEKAAEDVINPLVEKEFEEGLTALEGQAMNEAVAERVKLYRPKKVKYAKDQQEKLYNAYNKRMAEGQAVNINAVTKRAKLNPANQATFNSFTRIIKAATSLDTLEAKEKRGEALTQQEKLKKSLNLKTIDEFPLPNEAYAPLNTTLNEKGDYNNARAKLTQLKNIPNDKLNFQQKANKAKAQATIAKYNITHPEAAQKRAEQEESQREGKAELNYTKAKRALNNISKKNKPLSPENAAEQARLQGIVNAYKAAHPNANTENVEIGKFFKTKYDFNNNESKPKGGRRTRKVRRSKRKTYRRKH
jgi:hypothetical protein